MYYNTGIEINSGVEFLASEKVISFTGTVVSTGITANELGRKIVPKGSLISANGKIVKLTIGEGDAVTFSEPPVGILFAPVDVTYGEQPGAIMVEGYVIGQRLNLGVEYTDNIGDKIHEVLPEIKFVKKEEEE
jgi:hypothetical protein|nr:MAG TPA: Head decoration protein [Caudoviricetes sp.]